MAPQVTFPAHTEARIAAAKAAKKANRLKKPSADRRPVATFRYPALSGEVMGLSVNARWTILQSDVKIFIGCGTLQAFVPLVKNVNLAMLNHYIPYIVANHKYTIPSGRVILLPHRMSLATDRGIKYVVNNMKRALQEGSYAVHDFTNDDKDEDAICMVRPCRNPVDMVHGLNTLRAFGLVRDARFLSMEEGPIMTSLEREVAEWRGTNRTLERFLTTVGQKLLVESDRHLLAPAWAAYRERHRADSRPKTSGPKA